LPAAITPLTINSIAFFGFFGMALVLVRFCRFNACVNVFVRVCRMPQAFLQIFEKLLLAFELLFQFQPRLAKVLAIER